jgi:hypothetical protein
MKQYLLSVYHAEGEGNLPPPEMLEKIFGDVEALNQEIKGAGAWVFGGGLHPSSTAKVVRTENGKLLTSDGPFDARPAPMGGFWVIQAPDLDVAMGWAAKATRACALPIEVRPFEDEPES